MKDMPKPPEIEIVGREWTTHYSDHSDQEIHGLTLTIKKKGGKRSRNFTVEVFQYKDEKQNEILDLMAAFSENEEPFPWRFGTENPVYPGIYTPKDLLGKWLIFPRIVGFTVKVSNGPDRARDLAGFSLDVLEILIKDGRLNWWTGKRMFLDAP